MSFCSRTDLQINLNFLRLGTNLLQSFKLLFLSTLEKYQLFSHKGPWSATCNTRDPRELKSRKAEKENLSLNGKGLCFNYTGLRTG